MEFPWLNKQCILCLREVELTKEHIIPEALGGRLWARFLCKKCNDNMGDKIEDEAKRDPSIRLAIENLRNQIPDIAKTISEGQIFIGKGRDGPVRGIMKNGIFRPFSSKKKDGSLGQWIANARKTIEKRLRKSNLENAEIQSALKRFDEAPGNTPVKIIEGTEIIKSSIKPDFPALDGQMIEDTLPLKISYEYLACALGKTIYDERFSDIREALLHQSASQGSFKVEHLHSIDRGFEPFHGIYIEETKPHVVVRICIFGWLIYRVHFLRIPVTGPRHVYNLDLINGTEDWGVLT